MADVVSSRLGSNNNTSPSATQAIELFLKVYGGEVLTAFETKVKLKEVTKTREIASGKSASFPLTFQASGGWHTPGTELDGRAIKHSEKIITIDDLMVSDTSISSIDEAMNHYDVRSTYSEEQGRYLAKEWDANASRTLAQATLEDPIFAGDRGGVTNEVVDPDGKTNALSLAASIWEAKQNLEAGDVPVEDFPVYCALLPAEWYLLAQEPSVLLNRDISSNPGDYSEGTLSTVGGVNLIKSNNFRWGQNDIANVGPSMDEDKYQVNMTDLISVVFTEHAIGTLNLIGLNMDSEWLVRNRAYFTVAEYAAGHGTLITKASAGIRTVAS